MIPEIGQWCLMIAVLLATMQFVMPLAGTQCNKLSWMVLGNRAAILHCVFLTLAYGCLTWSFLVSDFSVIYVASNSNVEMPAFYKITAIWGEHEGSLFLWALLLGFWTLAILRTTRQLPAILTARIISMLGLVSMGMLVFVLLTANPFLRQFPVPDVGQTLNPLLQDLAMALHPPLLYAGYAGFAIPFAFAVATLLTGQIETQWVRWVRPWTTAAWLCLTLGIAVGSWWAYYELGWGGYWFWDPVENSAFMPWLIGTALIHSLASTEKRNLFQNWMLMLSITAFSLSLIGTFLGRSGALPSVHTFATDPTRGILLLSFFSVVIGGSLVLFFWRAKTLNRAEVIQPLSREGFLLMNNLLLCIAAALVFVGTFYPMTLKSLNLGSVSVGPPYYEAVFLIPMFPLLAVLGIGMHSAWRSASLSPLLRRLRIPAFFALILGTLVPTAIYGANSILIGAGVAAGGWTILAASIDPVKRLLGKGPRMTQSMVGMQVAHLGLGLTVIGITITSAFSIQSDRRVALGTPIDFANYSVQLEHIRSVTGPNYTAVQGDVAISSNKERVTVLQPEKRIYDTRMATITETRIDSNWRRDLIVALGDDLGQDTWSMRLEYQPMIRLIWLGTLIMALGGGIALSDRRYRVARKRAPKDALISSKEIAS